MKKIFIVLFLIGILLCEGKEVKIVIYNQNFAVIDELREIEVSLGKNKIIFTDIPKFIEPTSIQISSLNYPNEFKVLEHSFDSDVYNLEKIFSRNIGENIGIINKSGDVYSGKLLFYDAKNIGIETKDKILILNRDEIKEISFNKLDGLILKPQLNFLVQNNKIGIHKILLKYITTNINWKADYTGEYNEEKNKLKIDGFITIDNKSGIDYHDTSLILIAGRLKKMIEPQLYRDEGLMAKMIMEQQPERFEEEPFFEYHKYTLKEKLDLKDGELKQINFIKKEDVKVEKKYIYEGAILKYYHYENWRNLKFNEKVNVWIEFKNEDEILPEGKLKVFKIDKGQSIFIGESLIPHTPTGEKVKLNIGEAFDIKGERKILSHERISQQIYKDTYEIKIKNFKKEDIKIEVVEKLYGTWEIIEKTHDFEKVDAFTIKFPIKVKSSGEETIKYTVITKF